MWLEDFAASAERSRDADRPFGKVRISESTLAGSFLLIDVAISWSVVVVAHALYHGLYIGGPLVTNDVVALGGLISVVFAASQMLQGSYSPVAYIDRKLSLRSAAIGWLSVFFIIGWLAFLLKVTEDFSRAGLTASFFLGLAAIAAGRMTVAGSLSGALKSSKLVLRRVFLVSTSQTHPSRGILRHFRRSGSELVGSLVLPSSRTEAGWAHDLSRQLQDAFIGRAFDEIHVLVSWNDKETIRTLLAATSHLPVKVLLLSDPEFAHILQDHEMFRPNSTFEIRKAPLTNAQLMVKRMLDVSTASTALFLLLPLLAVAALAIRLESKGPVVFRQRRKGFGGRPFTIYKLRTMSVMEDGDVVVQATKGDARVTKVGAILRRTSIDELPQLWNVIAGDMSIIGPRPHAVAHDNYYDKAIATYAHRRRVKPGLTGWAQVNGHRGETKSVEAMVDRVSHDLWYVDNWSLSLDLKIIGKTVLTSLSQNNAY